MRECINKNMADEPEPSFNQADQSKLLLKHSKITMPTELYVAEAEAKANTTATRLTNTVSDAFLAKKLTAPKIVAVPSSHTDQPIYAKVYYPADYQEGETGKNRKAVIFNHGAGYLQNSHMGSRSWLPRQTSMSQCNYRHTGAEPRGPLTAFGGQCGYVMVWA